MLCHHPLDARRVGGFSCILGICLYIRGILSNKNGGRNQIGAKNGAPWAGADGPGPMGLQDLGLKDPGLGDPSLGVYSGARGRWGPKGSMGLGDPP